MTTRQDPKIMISQLQRGSYVCQRREGVYMYTDTQFGREVIVMCNALSVRSEGKGLVNRSSFKPGNELEGGFRLRICERIQVYNRDEKWGEKRRNVLICRGRGRRSFVQRAKYRNSSQN